MKFFKRKNKTYKNTLNSIFHNMNDFYSEMSPPSEVEIKKILLNEIRIKHSSLKEVDIIQCVNKTFEDYGGMKNIGSLTGWRMFNKKELLDMVTARLNCNNTNLNSQAL